MSDPTVSALVIPHPPLCGIVHPPLQRTGVSLRDTLQAPRASFRLGRCWTTQTWPKRFWTGCWSAVGWYSLRGRRTGHVISRRWVGTEFRKKRGQSSANPQTVPRPCKPGSTVRPPRADARGDCRASHGGDRIPTNPVESRPARANADMVGRKGQEGHVAQPGSVHRIPNPGVVGSNPTVPVPTTFGADRKIPSTVGGRRRPV